MIDDNLVAMSGLYSIAEERWWPAALEAAGISPGNLTAIVTTGEIAGDTAKSAAEFGMKAGIPVVQANMESSPFSCR